MPSPLMTRDGRHLAAARAPWWLRHAVAWTVPTAAFVVLVAAAGSGTGVRCVPSDPCGGDPVGKLLLGLLAASVAAVFVHAGVAAVLAGTFAAAALVADLTQPADGGPWWLHLGYVAYAALCWLVARLREPVEPGDVAFDWLARTAYAAPPAPDRLPGPGRRPRLLAAVLVVVAAGLVLCAVQRQTAADAQQAAAVTVRVRVVSHLDATTVGVVLPDGDRTRVTVHDAADHPVGSRFELLVDRSGLRQPLAEGYDAMGWLIPATALAGLAGALLVRGRRRAQRRRALFTGVQPVSAVFVCESWDRLAVYPADARAGEPAIAELLLWRDPAAAPPSALVEAVAEDGAAAPRSALLYGVPAPGQWCTVAVDDEVRIPRQPLRSGAAAPLFVPPGHDVDEAPMLDAPLRPEELAILHGSDRADEPLRLRRYAGHPVAAGLRLTILALGLAAVGTILQPLSWLQAVGYCATTTALACEAGWRLWLRPRLSWNGGGLAGIGVLRAGRFGWSEIRHILVDRGAVVVAGEQRALVVPAHDRLPWPSARRSAEQLALALRYARQRALADGTPTVLSPPPLPTPARPVALWLFGVALAVALAALLHGYA
jgi:hypothetical protein